MFVEATFMLEVTKAGLLALSGNKYNIQGEAHVICG